MGSTLLFGYVEYQTGLGKQPADCFLHVEMSAEAVPHSLPRVGSLASCERRDRDWTYKEFFQQELSISFQQVQNMWLQTRWFPRSVIEPCKLN